MRVHCCFVCRVGSIKAINVSKLRMTENLGVFCPRSVYEKHKKGKIPPKMVSRVQHHGKWVVGTLLEPSHGNPVGTFQTDSITEVGAAKEGEILSTGDAVDDDDYQQTWTAAQARLRTKTSSNNLKAKSVFVLPPEPQQMLTLTMKTPSWTRSGAGASS
jgi:hypothetical protein